ncbi:hypothetical protein ACS0TY_027200 [Phlomoides rotata]
MGLYFVIWGKQKDYKTPSTEEQELPVKQALNTKDGFESSTKNLVVVTSKNEEAKGRAIEDDERVAS